MELGQKIRQVRLEAGLSQRQLCGDVITRNMLSQIENGSARPSMSTLQYLAATLGKPIGFFLEETVPVLPNLPVMEQARQAQGAEVLSVLESYQAPDPVFDRERWLLEALACMDMAKQALAEEKYAYARELLQQAKAAGEQTPYYEEALERMRLLLCAQAEQDPATLVQALPSLDAELILRAQAALQENRKAAAYLDSVQQKNTQWYYLRGCAYEADGDYENAVQSYLQAESWSPRQIYGALERCYEKLENYKEAYRYACLQR